MPKTLPEELQEFFDELTAKVHAGEPLLERAGHIVREFMDIVGNVRRSLDEENLAIDLVQFQLDVKAGLDKLFAIVLKDRPWILGMLQGSSGVIATAITQAVAENAAAPIEFIDQTVVPIAREVEGLVHHIVVQLSGK